MKLAFVFIASLFVAFVATGGNAQGELETDVDDADMAALLSDLEAELEARNENPNAEADGSLTEDDDEEEFERQTKGDLKTAELKPAISRPFKPFPFYRPCKHPCCKRGEMNIGLGSLYGKVRGSLTGVTVVQSPTAQTGSYARQPCSRTALVKVNFKKITEEYCGDFCLESPLCDRRMLKIDMDLSPDARHYFLFNVGDSISNNGHAGDSNHQENDAEIDGRYPNIIVYSSDKCKNDTKLKVLATFSGAIGPTVDHVTLYVSNEHIRVTNNAGFDRKICHRCLYALNGQPDSGPHNPGPNEDIYIGFNRVVQHLGRNGYGTCSATLTWTCPWN